MKAVLVVVLSFMVANCVKAWDLPHNDEVSRNKFPAAIR